MEWIIRGGAGVASRPGLERGLAWLGEAGDARAGLGEEAARFFRVAYRGAWRGRAWQFRTHTAGLGGRCAAVLLLQPRPTLCCTPRPRGRTKPGKAWPHHHAIPRRAEPRGSSIEFVVMTRLIM